MKLFARNPEDSIVSLNYKSLLNEVNWDDGSRSDVQELLDTTDNIAVCTISGKTTYPVICHISHTHINTLSLAYCSHSNLLYTSTRMLSLSHTHSWSFAHGDIECYGFNWVK